MSLDYAILGFLGERPRSGYDLKVRCFDDEAHLLWSADQAQIYRTLERLRAAGLISRTRRRSQGRPDRLVYDITAVGRETLSTWAGCPSPLPPTRDAFALQLYFCANLSDPAITQMLAGRRAHHQDRLDDLRHHAELLAATTTVSDRAMVLRHTAFDGAMARERTTIDWLDDCIEAIGEGALPESADGERQEHLSGA